MNTLLAAAALAQTFNLSCAGQFTTEAFGGTDTKPFAHVYRMDLDKRKWCDGECLALQDFARIDPTVLTLQSVDKDTPSGREIASMTVNRQTGTFTGLSTTRSRALGTMIFRWTGQCEKQPFTGFPAFETKF